MENRIDKLKKMLTDNGYVFRNIYFEDAILYRNKNEKEMIYHYVKIYTDGSVLLHGNHYCSDAAPAGELYYSGRLHNIEIEEIECAIKKLLDVNKNEYTPQIGDYIAFGFNYNGGEPNEIIVDKITHIDNEIVTVHFLYGYKSLSESIKIKDIIAVGDNNSKTKIKGWGGKYKILLPNHKLLNK